MLSILRKARLKDKEMRILMLGLDNAGKTTIVKKIMGEDVNTVSPTLGFIIKTIDYDGYKLNIWDVGGQKTLRSYWRNYFEKTDALIWVVDATDRLRIEDCREELHGLLQEERLSGASLLVFANKTDVGRCMDEREILELESIRTHRWNVLRCSAMTGTNLEEGLAWVVDDAKKRLFLY
ncbi:ADP-ribosylation factor-like protein 2 like [Verticillium longisporum]|uniref:Abnormal eversion of vulva protein 20 n=1 Tax=Verticillium longisporum TaxID=100787 RepID=A0A8I3ATI6_VERLO|nr:ADP-ribosylation factor-like protein 2 like [Verticillium longisporum]